MLLGTCRAPGGLGSGLSLSATVNDTTFFGVNNTLYGGISTFDITMVAVSGGVPPYTHAWTRISGSTDVSPVSPTSANTYFFGSAYLSTITATFHDTVTDAASNTVIVGPITVQLTATGGFPQF